MLNLRVTRIAFFWTGPISMMEVSMKWWMMCTFSANEIPHRTAYSENNVEILENYHNILNTLSFFEYVIRLSTLEMTESILK